MLPTLLPGLTDADHRQRLRAVEACILLGDPAAAPWIRPLLQDRESVVRSAAIRALGDLKDEHSFAELVTCLAAATSHERIQAVHALIALGNPQMRTPLIHAVTAEPHYSVRIAIIKALSNFYTDIKVVTVIIHCLTDPNEDVRATAAVALAQMGATQAIPALQRMALSDTNHETMMNGMYTAISAVARQALAVLRGQTQHRSLPWPG